MIYEKKEEKRGIMDLKNGNRKRINIERGTYAEGRRFTFLAARGRKRKSRRGGEKREALPRPLRE